MKKITIMFIVLLLFSLNLVLTEAASLTSLNAEILVNGDNYSLKLTGEILPKQRATLLAIAVLENSRGERQIDDINSSNISDRAKFLKLFDADINGVFDITEPFNTSLPSGTYRVFVGSENMDSKTALSVTFHLNSIPDIKNVVDGIANAATPEQVKSIMTDALKTDLLDFDEENSILKNVTDIDLFSQVLLLSAKENTNLQTNTEVISRKDELLSLIEACAALTICFEKPTGSQRLDYIIENKDFFDIPYANTINSNIYNSISQRLRSLSTLSLQKFTAAVDNIVLFEYMNNKQQYGLIKEALVVLFPDTVTFTSAYNGLSNKDAVFQKMCGYSVDGFVYLTNSDIQSKFSQAVAECVLEQPSGGSSGDSRPTGGGGGGGGGGSIVETAVNMPENPNLITNVFNDIGSVSWAHGAIDFLYERSIISGDGNGGFLPGDNITRAEFLKMLIGACNIELTDDVEINYSDVNQNDWHYRYIKTAVKNEIATGFGDGMFGAKDYITRQDVAVMINRLKSYPSDPETLNSFNDKNEIADYAADSIGSLVKSEIITGRGEGMLAPRANMTRAEAAVILYRVLMKS